jgi:mTERF domain-containing protein, mitochondrial
MKTVFLKGLILQLRLCDLSNFNVCEALVSSLTKGTHRKSARSIVAERRRKPKRALLDHECFPHLDSSKSDEEMPTLGVSGANIESNDEGECDDEQYAFSSNRLDKVSLEELSSAFASNVSYFYLQNELGLSEEAMWRITYEAGSALGMTAEKIRRKVDVLRQAMDLSDDEVRSLLERQPTILHLSADNNISPTIQFLVGSLNLEIDQLRQLVMASPSIITYSTSNLNAKIKFFTRDLEYSISDARSLLLSEPKLIRSSVETGLVPHYRFLTRDLEIPIDKLRVVVNKNPRILIYSLDNNLIPKLVFYLILTLHMEANQVLRILLSYPAFVDYNFDNHILPISQYFLRDLECSPTELRSILLKFPRLVSYSLQNIKRTVGYFRYQISMTGSQVKRVLFQAPQVVGLSELNIVTTVAFLQESFEWTDDQVKHVIAGMPTLLSLSVHNNLMPKRDYLLESFDYNVQAVGDAVLKLPTLLGYSLDKRIRPRIEAIRQAGLDPSRITVGIPMSHTSFEGWLQRRAEKQMPTSISLPYSITPAASAATGPADRIFHWTRERRPPRTVRPRTSQ